MSQAVEVTRVRVPALCDSAHNARRDILAERECDDRHTSFHEPARLEQSKRLARAVPFAGLRGLLADVERLADPRVQGTHPAKDGR